MEGGLLWEEEAPTASLLGSLMYSLALPPRIHQICQGKDLSSTPSWLWQGKGHTRRIILNTLRAFCITKAYAQGKGLVLKLMLTVEKSIPPNVSLFSLTVSPKVIWGNKTVNKRSELPKSRWGLLQLWKAVRRMGNKTVPVKTPVKVTAWDTGPLEDRFNQKIAEQSSSLTPYHHTSKTPVE